jgi:hypothetical protein
VPREELASIMDLCRLPLVLGYKIFPSRYDGWLRGFGLPRLVHETLNGEEVVRLLEGFEGSPGC